MNKTEPEYSKTVTILEIVPTLNVKNFGVYT